MLRASTVWLQCDLRARRTWPAEQSMNDSSVLGPVISVYRAFSAAAVCRQKPVASTRTKVVSALDR